MLDPRVAYNVQIGDAADAHKALHCLSRARDVFSFHDPPPLPFGSCQAFSIDEQPFPASPTASAQTLCISMLSNSGNHPHGRGLKPLPYTDSCTGSPYLDL